MRCCAEVRIRRHVGWAVLFVALAGAIAAAMVIATRSHGTAILAKSTAPSILGTAIEVPGLAALNRGNASLDSLSCSSARNCAARGSYEVGVTTHGFAVSEKHGVWGTATPTDGKSSESRKALDALQKAHLSTAHLSQGFETVEDLVCTKPGFCVAGGSYFDGHQSGCGLEDGYCYQAWVANETNGVWGKAIEVPGTAKLNSDGDGSLDTISCWSTGNCTAAGRFMSGPAALSDEAFVVEERNGVWGDAVRFPIPEASLSAGGGFGIDNLVCDNARSCAAVGSADFGGRPRVAVFVANKTNGIWKAIQVPGLDPLEEGANGAIFRSLACTTARSCTAGGTYSVGEYPDGSTREVEPFLVTETNGVWGNAFTLPDFKDLNAGRFADLFSISCPTPTSCATGGSYTDGTDRQQGFVASEKNGVWQEAIAVPGLAKLNVGNNANGSDAEVDLVSCPTAGSCVAGGFYTDRSGHRQAFVTAR